ncbi:MAG: Ribonuclease [Actinomycetia bacterium]|nr:Ribonuclease [Actinomycetes bacterium]
MQWIDDTNALRALLTQRTSEPAYALDTEFHGERTYWPRLALVQIAWPDDVALVDPFALDARALCDLIGSPATMVAHAADQDLAILDRLCGKAPAALFDTQVAAGFLGMGSPSLSVLVEKMLGTRLGKGDRLTDWTVRPLTSQQQVYAAADVEYLLPLRDVLVAELEKTGRLQWALDECETRRVRDRSRPDPLTAWWKIKGSRQLRGKARGVAQELAAWRDRKAEAIDVPPRFVLSDLAMAALMQRAPHARDDLKGIRGIEPRHLKDGTADEILQAVATGVALGPGELRLPDTERVDRSLQPAVTVLSAWLAQQADELRLDPSVLATRADIAQFIADGTGRLASGWRADLVGEPVRRLLAGDATISLADGGRRLKLDRRDTT